MISVIERANQFRKGNNMDPNVIRREKARNLRYKKPLVKEMNLDFITQEMWDISDACNEVFDLIQNDDLLLDAFDGDTDEASEFRMAFSDLSAECEKMKRDLDEEWVPDCFDRFFVAVGAGESYGGLCGYHTFVEDYFGLSSGEAAWAMKENTKVLKRMTKDELIEAAQQCFRVFQQYIALRYRYDCLRSALDILRGYNSEYFHMIEDIDRLYDEAGNVSCRKSENYQKKIRELERVLGDLPKQAWVL